MAQRRDADWMLLVRSAERQSEHQFTDLEAAVHAWLTYDRDVAVDD